MGDLFMRSWMLFRVSICDELFCLSMGAVSNLPCLSGCVADCAITQSITARYARPDGKPGEGVHVRGLVEP